MALGFQLRRRFFFCWVATSHLLNKDLLVFRNVSFFSHCFITAVPPLFLKIYSCASNLFWTVSQPKASHAKLSVRPLAQNIPVARTEKVCFSLATTAPPVSSPAAQAMRVFMLRSHRISNDSAMIEINLGLQLACDDCSHLMLLQDSKNYLG